MIPVFRVNYTVSEDDGSITFTNFFYARDVQDASVHIKSLMNDFKVKMGDTYVDECAIYGIGERYDVMVSIEQVQLIEDGALEVIIKNISQ